MIKSGLTHPALVKAIRSEAQAMFEGNEDIKVYDDAEVDDSTLADGGAWVTAYVWVPVAEDDSSLPEDWRCPAPVGAATVSGKCGLDRTRAEVTKHGAVTCENGHVSH
jgi:hypothetical protein